MSIVFSQECRGDLNICIKKEYLQVAYNFSNSLSKMSFHSRCLLWFENLLVREGRNHFCKVIITLSTGMEGLKINECIVRRIKTIFSYENNWIDKKQHSYAHARTRKSLCIQISQNVIYDYKWASSFKLFLGNKINWIPCSIYILIWTTLVFEACSHFGFNGLEILHFSFRYYDIILTHCYRNHIQNLILGYLQF